MQLRGYPDDGQPSEEVVHSDLAEINVTATPAELRRMADFFIHCANEMERMGATYDHIHLSDRMKEFRDSPHVVVMRHVGEL